VVKRVARNNRPGPKKKLRAIPDSLIKYLIFLTHILYNTKKEILRRPRNGFVPSDTSIIMAMLAINIIECTHFFKPNYVIKFQFMYLHRATDYIPVAGRSKT